MNDKMTADNAAAALSLATEMGEGLIPQMMPESPEMALGGEEAPEQEETEQGGKVAELEAKMEDMKKEMQQMIKDEVAGIKDAIQEALNEQT